MKFCPHCGGDLSKYANAESKASVPQEKYDQTKTWKRLVGKVREQGGAPPGQAELVEQGVRLVQQLVGQANGQPVETIVHLVFDRDVVPSGGVLYRAVMSDGKLGVPAEQLEHMGYAVADGKIVLVDDIPVSQAYAAIEYWGGEKQHRRWHLSRPVTVDPSRNGNPFFMDGEMVAFGASWKDADKVGEALTALLDLFSKGIGGERPLARGLVLELAAIG